MSPYKKALMDVTNHKDVNLLCHAATHISDTDVLTKLSKNKNKEVRIKVYFNDNTPPDIQNKLALRGV